MDVTVQHMAMADLDAGLEHVRRSPKDHGTLDLVVRRPGVGEREVLAVGRLDVATGLDGDSWERRPSKETTDGSPHPLRQLNIMNSRAVELVAGDTERWALAGDQLFVDLDISGHNLPPGSRLRIGGAVVEVTELPHTGCAKFTARFGRDALRWVNSEEGRRLNLRGICARVTTPGTVRPGDTVSKVAPA